MKFRYMGRNDGLDFSVDDLARRLFEFFDCRQNWEKAPEYEKDLWVQFGAQIHRRYIHPIARARLEEFGGYKAQAEEIARLKDELSAANQKILFMEEESEDRLWEQEVQSW